MTIFLNIPASKCPGILQEIFSNVSDYSYISFVQHDIDGSSKELNLNNTNSYTFSITDTNFNVLDFNGINVIFSLVLYKKNDIGEITLVIDS